ncbi:MAG: helix-turn-helix transcriptional regulator [Clostridia bacterium]|nr:helix-turn-helix transcriptional regulator [Clostridia bacterium]
MAVPFPSALIRYERLKRNWSQEGLCEGICSVSYLSKIEQGKAEAGEEILSALIRRLELEWHGGEEAQEARKLLDDLEEACFSLNIEERERLREQLKQKRDVYLNGPHMLDVLLLERLGWGNEPADVRELCTFEECFTQKQRAIWLMVQKRFEEAIQLLPIADTYMESGYMAYYNGQYTHAMERLLRACSLAAEEGRARVLLYARMLLGNCYSDQGDYDAMNRHYQAALRLATDLGDEGAMESIRYNIVATQVQLGMYEKAYQAYTAMDSAYPRLLHKLAVCQEQIGLKEEALQTLDRVDALTRESDMPEDQWAKRMCELVRYRLEHPDYLKEAAYGELLLTMYQDMQKGLPNGYALFHQRWVEEWYVATRQYKQAYELKKKNEFSK